MHLYSMRNSRRGTMLIVVLGLLVALFVIGTSFSYIVLAERKASTNYLDRQRALDLAFDGVEYSIARLRAESTRNHYEGLSDKEFEYDPVGRDIDGPNFARKTLDSRDVRVSWNKTTTTTNNAKDQNPDRGWIDFNNNGTVDGNETRYGGDKMGGASAANARNFLSGVTLFHAEGIRIDSNPRESRTYENNQAFGASGTYEDLGDYTRVKVIDAAAQFNLNSFKGDRLAEMLMVLGVEIDKWVSGGKGSGQFNPFQSDVVEAVVKTHEEAGNFLTNKEQLRPLWDGSSASRKVEFYDLAMNFVTVNNWQDIKYREYVDNAAVADPDKAKNPTGKMPMEIWREGYSNPGQPTGGREGWPDWQPDASTSTRAPINVNTAPKPVLVMLFLGLEARARMLYFRKANAIAEEDTLYKELFGVAPQRLVFGTPDIGRQNGVPLQISGVSESPAAAPGSGNKGNQAIFQLVDIGPITGAPTGGQTTAGGGGADLAGALADEIIAQRKVHPFTSWQDFDTRFCYQTLLGLSANKRDTMNVPDLVSAQRSGFTDPGNVTGLNLKLLPDPRNCKSAANPLPSTDASMSQTAFKAWYWKSCVDMIRASLNPNNTTARYNADYPYHKNVDRMDLVKACPPVCFSSMGIYEVVSQGEVLAPVTRGLNSQETTTVAGGTSNVRMPVARRQVRTLVEIYSVLRHTSQVDFMTPLDPDVITNAATASGSSLAKNVVSLSKFGTMTGPYSADERAAGVWTFDSTTDPVKFPEDSTYLGQQRKNGYNKPSDLSRDFGYVSQRPQDRTPMQPMQTGLTFHLRANEGLDGRTPPLPGSGVTNTSGVYGLNSWDGGGDPQDAIVGHFGNKPWNDRVVFDDFVSTATPRKVDRANNNAQDEFASADKAEGIAGGPGGGESTRYATLVPDGVFLRSSAIRTALRYEGELASMYGKRGIGRMPRLKLLRYPNATKDTNRPFGPIAAGSPEPGPQDQAGAGITEVRKRLEGNPGNYSGTDAHNQALENTRQTKINCPYYEGTIDFWIKWDFPPQGSDDSAAGSTASIVCLGEIDPSSQNFSGLFGATAFGRVDFFEDSGKGSNPNTADRDMSDASDPDRNNFCDIEGVQFFIFKEPGGVLRFSRMYFTQALAADVPASIWSQTASPAVAPPRAFGNWKRRIIDEGYAGGVNKYTATGDICPAQDPNDKGFKYCRTDGWVNLNTILASEFKAGLRAHDWHRLTLAYNSKSTTQPYDFWIDGQHVTVTFQPDDNPMQPKGLLNDGHHEPNPGVVILPTETDTEYLFFRNTTPILEVNPEDRLTIGCLFRRQPDFNSQVTYDKYFLDPPDPTFVLKPTRPVFKFDSNLVAVANATLDDVRISSTLMQPSYSVNATDYANNSRYIQSGGVSSTAPNYFEQGFLPMNPNGAEGAMLTSPVRMGTLSWTEYRPDWDPYMGKGINLPTSARVIVEWAIFDNVRSLRQSAEPLNFAEAKARGIIDDPVNEDNASLAYWARGGVSLQGQKMNAGTTVGMLVYRLHFVSPDAQKVPVTNVTAYIDDVTLTILTPPRKLAFVIEY